MTSWPRWRYRRDLRVGRHAHGAGWRLRHALHPAAARGIGEGLAARTATTSWSCAARSRRDDAGRDGARDRGASGKTGGRDFGVCFNPEFLREGVAVADFHAPPKTVIGATDDRAAADSGAHLRPGGPQPIILTSIEVAEMVKYVDNVWHATKVTFANEIGRLCKPLAWTATR
jgi:GDP-mannose 6-dehydrogenase